jgi:hypothetical protein
MNSTDADWPHIEPLLDEAMDALDDSDRAAVLLRYFENQSLREVGAALGTSDDAAQKRVSRAVDRLREFFAKRGVTVGTSRLVLAVAANAAPAAPAGLAATISAGALFAGTTFAITTTAAATKAIAMTTLQKTLVTAAVAVLAGAGIYEARQASQLRKQNRALQQQLELANGQRNNSDKAPPPVPVAAQSESPVPPAKQSLEAEWTERLLALNGADWRQAFSTGQKLAALSSDTGLAILRAHWNSITNVDARQQLLKAFDFAQHERLPAVLEMGLLDPSPSVQT